MAYIGISGISIFSVRSTEKSTVRSEKVDYIL